MRRLLSPGFDLVLGDRKYPSCPLGAFRETGFLILAVRPTYDVTLSDMGYSGWSGCGIFARRSINSRLLDVLRPLGLRHRHRNRCSNPIPVSGSVLYTSPIPSIPIILAGLGQEISEFSSRGMDKKGKFLQRFSRLGRQR